MKEIVSIHLERADEVLRDARILLDSNSPSGSISRSYYGIFHGAKAVLAELDLPRKSHQAVWGAFSQFVTNPGLMDRKYHAGGIDLFASRLDSDYLPKPKDTLKTAEEALSFATEFVAACRTFLGSREKGV